MINTTHTVHKQHLLLHYQLYFLLGFQDLEKEGEKNDDNSFVY